MRQAAHLLRLRPAVAWFYVRALGTAWRRGDRWSLKVATRPRELGLLLRAARGRRRAVEVGTGTAWTTVALTIADPARAVLTIDPVAQPARGLYLGLASAGQRGRIELRAGSGADGPRPDDPPVDFLFIDGSHERADTREAFAAWRAALADDAVVVFHDYGDPAYPGVAQAVADLGLAGRARGRCFICAVPGGGA